MDEEASTRCQQLANDLPQQDQENNDQEPPTIKPLREEVLDPTDHENEYRDMPGIDSEVACHQLNVDLSCPPHRQNQRRFAPERNQIINAEVDRLIEVGFICDVWCSTWVSNVVVVGKKEKENGACVWIIPT
ncbi:hypothetical protein ACFX1X_031021 [Malus domestica]